MRLEKITSFQPDFETRKYYVACTDPMKIMSVKKIPDHELISKYAIAYLLPILFVAYNTEPCSSLLYAMRLEFLCDATKTIIRSTFVHDVNEQNVIIYAGRHIIWDTYTLFCSVIRMT